MTKKKTRVLWLYTYSNYYQLCDEEPEWDNVSKWWDGGEIYDFCGKEFILLFPSLKLRKNTKCKLKLTQLKNGIKLEKVK